MKGARRTILAVVVLAVLAVPGTAAAHPRARTAALDYRLRLPAAPLPGVRADVIDGDRELRLRVDARLRLVVRGLLGEAALRFGADGVWVNRGSPTAASDKLTKPGTGWARLTSGHSLVWHDHRLAPPAGLPAGATAPFALPVTVDGRRTAIRGSFFHARRPTLWPWLAGIAAALVLVFAAARAPARRDLAAAVTAGAAVTGALIVGLGLATAGPVSAAGAWVQAANAAVLALAAGVVLLRAGRTTRTWTATVVGAVAAALTIGSMGVFWHGVVISSLPAWLVRLATAAAVVGGCTAAVVGAAAAADSKAVRP